MPQTSRVTQTAVSRRMEATGSTPTKSFCRLFLSPNSKNSVCLQCGNQIDNADKRRKLFDGGEKTQFCKILDRIFTLSSPYSGDISHFTNIICRSCSDKNITLLKKVDNAGRVLTETQDCLSKERGETATKRGLSCEGEETKLGASNTGGRAKRRIALFSEASINSSSPTKSVKDKGTQTDQDDSSASVSVSLVSSIIDKSRHVCKYIQ